MERNIINVAKGIEPADLVLKNGLIINMFTEEIIKADVAILGDKIAGVGTYFGKNEIDCSGYYISPGFIDSHMHIESTMVTPLEFSKSVIKKGTTTTIIDPHEIVNVAGKIGLDYMLKSTENIPINAYVMIPSSVPASDIDVNGVGEFLAIEMEPYLTNDRVLGLGEVMRFHDVINCENRIMDKIEMFKDKIIDGHAPSLEREELQGYRAAGVNNDHECETIEEALEKLRAGFSLLIREGSGARNLEPIIKGLLKSKVSLDNCMFCTDDKHLEDIEEEGHINYCVKRAIELGVPIIKAYKMATYNSAKAYNLRELGAIGAGYKADILILKSLEEASPSQIIKGGIIINDKSLAEYNGVIENSQELLNTVKCNPLSYESIKINRSEKNHVIEIVPYSLLTTHKFEEIPGINNTFIPNKEFSKLCVVERHGRTNGVGVCALKSYGIENGAIATSVSHDSHNIIVVGDNDEDIIIAVNELRRLQGGYVIASKGKILESLTLEIAGLMSTDTKENVQSKVKIMVSMARKLGVSKEVDPFITLSFIALSVIPEVRLTEGGLYDVIKQTFID